MAPRSPAQILADARERGLDTTLAQPYEVVADTPLYRLRRYAGGDGRPLLIIYSLVNRPELLDLSPRRSVITALRDSRPVYLLDWRDPTPMDRFRGLADYVFEGVGDALARVHRHSGQTAHVAGVCQGGYLALCYLGMYPDAAASFIALATPVDGATADDALSRIAARVNLAAVEAGERNVRASELNWAFASLRPFPLLLDRYRQLPQLEGNDTALGEFLRMERWMYGGPDQALVAFVEFIRALYRDNALIHGTLNLREHRARLDRLNLPVFNVAAEADHLVPPAAARALRGHVRGAYQEHILPGGHLGVFVSRSAHSMLYPTMTQWLNAQD
ncbi:alpha/beta fold hydrolase [Arhodomonas sp. AD133]|uniref:alpha/beta fold hydrolase n=1 Tax=Arhodomonas sp. AD133 TaxID=3415009 RepID=UPI003EBB0BF8